MGLQGNEFPNVRGVGTSVITRTSKGSSSGRLEIVPDQILATRSLTHPTTRITESSDGSSAPRKER